MINKNKQNAKKIAWTTVLAVGILVMIGSSLITFVFDSSTNIDFDLKPKISQQLGITSMGHIQSVKTRVIGPFTTINLQFFKENDQLVSANAFRVFWFEPKITCASSNPEVIC